MKAIGYVRVSTQGQAEDGVSLEAQQAKIAAWCIANDYELTAIFEDAGLSGKTTNRAGLQRALDAIDKGAALIVYSLSRLTRSTKDMLHLADLLERKAVDLVSLNEKIDTTTAAGKMLFRMLAVLNEFERDQISERTKAALTHKKDKGERIGTVPYGFSLASDGTTLRPEETEQEILGLIQSLRREGYTLQAIANQLNKDGIYTRRGTEWRHQYIHSLLKAA